MTVDRRGKVFVDESPFSYEDFRAGFRAIVSRLSDPDARVSPEAADFWRRAIIDVVTATVMHSQPPGTTETIPSATRLIRNAEHYIETAGSRPVHISEICAECGVDAAAFECHKAEADRISKK